MLEILVVISILAALAAIAAPAIQNVNDIAGEDLARTEMHRLATALRRFKKDTGYFPKQGPFSAVNLSADIADGSNRADSVTKINHPANWSQLYLQPENVATGVDIRPWDRDVAVGWRGPYLSDFGEGIVDVGIGVNNSGNGDPYLGDIIEVRSVADSFPRRASGLYMIWNNDINEVRGRPYLFFVDDGTDADGVNDGNGCVMPCIVGLGSNGEYDLGGGDDIVLSIGGS